MLIHILTHGLPPHNRGNVPAAVDGWGHSVEGSSPWIVRRVDCCLGSVTFHVIAGAHLGQRYREVNGALSKVVVKWKTEWLYRIVYLYMFRFSDICIYDPIYASLYPGWATIRTMKLNTKLGSWANTPTLRVRISCSFPGLPQNDAKPVWSLIPNRNRVCWNVDLIFWPEGTGMQGSRYRIEPWTCGGLLPLPARGKTRIILHTVQNLWPQSSCCSKMHDMFRFFLKCFLHHLIKLISSPWGFRSAFLQQTDALRRETNLDVEWIIVRRQWRRNPNLPRHQTWPLFHVGSCGPVGQIWDKELAMIQTNKYMHNIYIYINDVPTKTFLWYPWYQFLDKQILWTSHGDWQWFGVTLRGIKIAREPNDSPIQHPGARYGHWKTPFSWSESLSWRLCRGEKLAAGSLEPGSGFFSRVR